MTETQSTHMLINNLRLIEIELSRQLTANALVLMNPELKARLTRALIELRAALDYLASADETGE